ncbi:hypothetical protein DEO72_LG4g974 [Vigna unguiculata]|uniref:Uncharacterized protein n=1 Tax=Vigna unguiculata TaxID=3917 RepID=A0A4D6LMH9_VIGUN|nr:hypothetical protein DEO72_LG4g974 [Vigna unguiculata]
MLGPPSDSNNVSGVWYEFCLAVKVDPLGGCGGISEVLTWMRLAAIWKLLKPSGTCPPLGDLAVVSPSFEFAGVIYKTFGDGSKVRLLGSLS